MDPESSLYLTLPSVLPPFPVYPIYCTHTLSDLDTAAPSIDPSTLPSISHIPTGAPTSSPAHLISRAPPHPTCLTRTVPISGPAYHIMHVQACEPPLVSSRSAFDKRSKKAKADRGRRAWRREHKRTAERDTGEKDMIRGGCDAIIDFVVV